MDINSKEWWINEHNHNWINEGVNGIEQTKMFAEIAYGILNPAIKLNISTLNGAFVDWGCALGQGCECFLNQINYRNNNKIYGIDIADTAINKAKDMYSEYQFYTDIDYIKADIDLIYTSNTLEHFHNPTEYIEKLINITNKYLIILVPYMQDITNLHFFKFTYEYFQNLKVNAQLIQFTRISAIDEWYSPTSQILAVYYK
jgi:trans-aconitate methyltransferase